MTFETERLILRPWREDDAEALYKCASDPDVGPPAGWLPHTSVENSREIIKTILSADNIYAVCLKDGNGTPIGNIHLNRNTDMTDRPDECELGYWLGKPYWGQGIIPEAGRRILKYAFCELGMVAVWCGRYDGNEKSRRVQEKLGFVHHHSTEGLVIPHFNELRLGHVMLLTKESWKVWCTIEKMKDRITNILNAVSPSIYIYGSYTEGDFKEGWSDIDILVLTEKEITEDQAEALVHLRQIMKQEEPDVPHYRSFEGAMLTRNAFLSGAPDRVVYWGTGGERITDKYSFDVFGMTSLLKSGVLLHGKDIREQLPHPGCGELKAAVERHYRTIRDHAQKTGRSFYSYGWLLDISRCIYTLRTGKTIPKTDAGEWALSKELCPSPHELALAVKIRKEPLKYKNDEGIFDHAEKLGEHIQKYADVLMRELYENNASSKETLCLTTKNT